MLARDGPAGFAEDRNSFILFDDEFVGDPVIGAELKIRRPGRAHPLAAADGLTERVDEGVIVGHQGDETFDVMSVDAVHEGDSTRPRQGTLL